MIGILTSRVSTLSANSTPRSHQLARRTQVASLKTFKCLSTLSGAVPKHTGAAPKHMKGLDITTITFHIVQDEFLPCVSDNSIDKVSLSDDTIETFCNRETTINLNHET